jgi:hypothetical protein
MRFNRIEVFESNCCYYENGKYENGEYELHTYADFFELLQNPNDIENIHILTANFQLKSLKDALQFGLTKTNILTIDGYFLNYAYFVDWLQSPDFPFFKVRLIVNVFSDLDKVIEIMKTPGLNLKMLELDYTLKFSIEFDSFCERLTQHPCYLQEIQIVHLFCIIPTVILEFILEFNTKLRLQETFKLLLAAESRKSEISKITKIPKELIRMIQSFLIQSFLI